MRKKGELLESLSGENPRPQPKELLFRCPDCGGSELRQLVTGIRLSRELYGVYEDGTLELGKLEGPIDDEDDGVFYECADCIYPLQDTSGNLVSTEHDLVKWLKDNSRENTINVQS
jgi:hypothetical protein